MELYDTQKRTEQLHTAVVGVITLLYIQTPRCVVDIDNVNCRSL